MNISKLIARLPEEKTHMTRAIEGNATLQTSACSFLEAIKPA